MSIANDAIFENSETFNVVLSGPVNATILDGTGVGTIRDDGTGLGGTDNDTPSLSITNVTVTEGTETHAVFELNLSNASTTDVTVALALANVTAVGGGVDYGTAGAGNLQVSNDGGTTWVSATSATIAAGTTSVLVRTPITDDTAGRERRDLHADGDADRRDDEQHDRGRHGDDHWTTTRRRRCRSMT